MPVNGLEWTAVFPIPMQNTLDASRLVKCRTNVRFYLNFPAILDFSNIRGITEAMNT